MSLRLSAVAAGTTLLMALSPVASAAPVVTDACATALAAAQKSEHDYDALKKELTQIIADGGHPDASQRQALAEAESKRDMTASQAQRICGP